MGGAAAFFEQDDDFFGREPHIQDPFNMFEGFFDQHPFQR